MDNHYHLVVELAQTNPGRAMQWLNVSYSVWFNGRHQRSGHLFQGRYKAIVVDPTGWGLEVSRYVQCAGAKEPAAIAGRTGFVQGYLGGGTD